MKQESLAFRRERFNKAIQWDLIHLYGGEYPLIFLEDSPRDAASVPSHARFGYSPRQIRFWDDRLLRSQQFSVLQESLRPKWREMWVSYKKALGETVSEELETSNIEKDFEEMQRMRKPAQWSPERFTAFRKNFDREARNYIDRSPDFRKKVLEIGEQRSRVLARTLKKTYRSATRIFAIAGALHVSDLLKEELSADTAYLQFADSASREQGAIRHLTRILSSRRSFFS